VKRGSGAILIFILNWSNRESGPCLSPSVADHPKRPATDHRLGKLLPHQLANQTRAGGFLLLLLRWRGISSRFQLLFPSQGQVLTRYSPVRHWKHHFPSDLHVLSMPPAFILSQDRTLHEIHSCITYSFKVRRQSGKRIFFHSKA